MFTLETFAILMTVVCIVLAGKNSVHTWWTGIVACIAYGFVFYDAKLYADAQLQIFFVGSSVYGWYIWKESKGQTKTPISRESVDTIVKLVGLSVTVAGIYGYALSTMTDSPVPYLDATVLAFSVLAQVLMARRKIESWPMWIVVNTISVPLYFSRDLDQTAWLYMFFWAHGWFAMYQWNKEMKTQGI